MAGAVDNSGAAQSVTAKDGMFVVDGQAMDLGTLMLTLSMEQTSLIDDQISAQMSQIQDQNNKLKELNDLLAQMESAKANGDKMTDFSSAEKMAENLPGGIGDAFESVLKNAESSQSITLAGSDESKPISEWMNEFGLTVTPVTSDDKDTRNQQWDANIQAVQGAQSGLNSDSQLSMTQLQQLINARNTSYDMASNFLSTDQRSKDTITNNL